ncbi:hypothetical protein ACR3K2_10460 [Cryptosporidium serpentis]
MARKRKYQSAMEDIDPCLNPVYLPNENYYRNPTETPAELLPPHISTNPAKPGNTKCNSKILTIYQNPAEKIKLKSIRRNLLNNNTIIPCNKRSDMVDILNDDISFTEIKTKSIITNNMSRKDSKNNKNLNKIIKPRVDKGDSNLPPLPRTEDYWPKLVTNGYEEHESYLDRIRKEHLDNQYQDILRLKSENKNRNFQCNHYYEQYNIPLGNSNLENNHNAGNSYYNKLYLRSDEGIYCVETPLRNVRDIDNKWNNVNAKKHGILQDISINNTNFNNLQTKGTQVDETKYLNNKKNIAISELPKNLKCDAIVGGNTPLRNTIDNNDLDEIVLNRSKEQEYRKETNDIAVGPSPNSHILSHDLEKTPKIEKIRPNSILRKSIEICSESSKQVRFSTRYQSDKSKFLLKFEELNFDPTEEPLVNMENSEYSDGSMEIGDNIHEDYSIFDFISLDNRILLRLMQICRKELDLVENLTTQIDDIGINSDYTLVNKAINGIYKYFLIKAVDYGWKKDNEFNDVKYAMAKEYRDNNVNYYNSIINEREILKNKIGIYNSNIQKLKNALSEADKLKELIELDNFSKNKDLTNTPEIDKVENINKFDNQEDRKWILQYVKYLFNGINGIINNNGNTLSDINEYNENNNNSYETDNSNDYSPTPVLKVLKDDNSELRDHKLENINNNSFDKNICGSSSIVDDILSECHKMQFISMESIAFLNDCIALLNDAEIGMQNFQKLLAHKAFDIHEDDKNGKLSNNIDEAEDAMLRLQRGASITPRFSIDSNTGSYNRTSISSRISTTKKKPS